MPKKKSRWSPPGTEVTIKGGIKAYVEEYEHAYLVRAYGIMWGITAKQAQLALFEFLGRKKWTRIARMPYRPLYTSEIGDERPTGAVAFYFNIGRREHAKPAERDKYKP